MTTTNEDRDQVFSAENDVHSTESIARGAPAAVWVLDAGAPGGGMSFRLAEGEARVLGSSPSSDVRLVDPAVSARHVRLSVEKGRLSVRDLDSRNGLYTGAGRVVAAELDDDGTFVVGRTVVSCSPVRTGDPDVTTEPPLEGIVGDSLAMRRLARDVRHVAPLRAPVLIRGETGSGKELVAEALHRFGPRASKPFVALNMGALPGELADAELFGHERGAFTGAIATRPGAFELARGGTLFLDEVAELPLPSQAKLLRALENGEVRSLGANAAKRIDVRVVSATWAPIDARVIEGAFREDLFHRLAVLTIRVPPLRDRKGDLGLLATALLARHHADVGDAQLSAAAIAKLAAHRWPGNVRELRNVLLRAAVFARGRVIGADHVRDAIEVGAPAGEPRIARAVDRREQARSALAACHGNVSEAARMLGVARSTLRMWAK